MLVNCIAFYKPPVRLLAQTCLSSESIIGDNIVEGAHRLLPTKVSNTQSFGADKFTKTYAQSQVVETNSFGDQIIGTGILVPTLEETNIFGSDKFTKTYAQTKVSNSNTFGADTIADVVASVCTWDTGLPLSSNVALSNGNLTATSSANVDQGASATNFALTGKHYFELIFNGLTSGDSGGGIRVAGTTYSNLGNDVTGGALAFKSGNVYVDGAGKNNIGSFSGGGTMCVAVDLDNLKIWFRKDGGSWNAGGGADPATNTGGYDISSFCPATGVYACCVVAGNGDTCTANFGATTFNQSVPSGFTGGWPTTDEAAVGIDLDSVGTQQFSGTNSATITLPGSNGANRTIFVCVHNEKNGGAPSVSSVTATGLTFTRRSQYQYSPGGTTDNYLEIWTAPASSALGSTTITINTSANTDDSTAVCFSASGINATPLDGNGSLPATASAFNDNGPASVSGVSTSHSPDLLIGVWGTSQSFNGPPPPPNWCQVANRRNNGGANWSRISVFAATKKATISSQTITSGSYGSSFCQWGFMVDAFKH